MVNPNFNTLTLDDYVENIGELEKCLCKTCDFELAEGLENQERFSGRGFCHIIQFEWSTLEPENKCLSFYSPHITSDARNDIDINMWRFTNKLGYYQYIITVKIFI